MSVDAACRDCGEGLAHCHGLLVVHGDGALTCLEDVECRLQVHEHDHVLECHVALVACGCGTSFR